MLAVLMVRDPSPAPRTPVPALGAAARPRVRRATWWLPSPRQRLVWGLVCALALLVSAPESAARERDTSQPTKINWVDASKAPQIRIFGSILGSDSRPVPSDLFKAITAAEKPERGKAKELFTIEFSDEGDVVTWHNRGEEGDSDEVAGDDEVLPTLTLGEEQEEGLDVVVVVPGFAPTYRDTLLGQAVKDGAGLFFKKLGKTNRMNVIWYSDLIRTFVEAKGTMDELTVMSGDIQARCDAQALDELERYGEPPPEEPPALADDRARCGLTSKYDTLGDIIANTAFEGGFPNLFGIDVQECVPPEMQRAGLARFKAAGDDDAEEDAATSMSAIELALRMLVQGGAPGRQKALILLSDGRDGYVNALRDCRDAMRRTVCKSDDRKAEEHCVNTKIKQAIVAEQRQFAAKAKVWIALAKSAGIRIFTVVHPTAQPHERERLEVLAWRTGGTARFAEDQNQLVDLYSALIDEINGQYVLSFVDDDATPGAERAYEVSIKGGGGKTRTKPYSVTVAPEVELSLAGKFAGALAAAEAKLGRKVLLAIVIGLLVVLLLIVVKVMLGMVKKKAAGAAKKKKGKKK